MESMTKPNSNGDYGSFSETPTEEVNRSLLRPGGASGEPEKSSTAIDIDDSETLNEQLRIGANQEDTCSSDEEYGGANSSGYTRHKSRHHRPEHPPNARSNEAESSRNVDGETNEAQENAPIPSEPHKTLVALLFFIFGSTATATSLTLTNERLPKDPPLPDVFLDNVDYQPWGLTASEIIIMVFVIIAAGVALFHQHRFVIFRRIFFLGGLHYLYRAITMTVTVLPNPDPNYACHPKSNNLTVLTVVERVIKVLSGFGLTINGEQIYCGDYIYSGHTMTLIMTYLIISEYSPKRWKFVHWLALSGTVVGVITLLCSRGHYSIDVLIAYWITTRLWWIYHTMANNKKICDKENKHSYLDRFWWWPVFVFLEGNVSRPLPKGFNWPLPDRVLIMCRRITRCGRQRATESNAESEDSRSTRISTDPELGLVNE